MLVDIIDVPILTDPSYATLTRIINEEGRTGFEILFLNVDK